MNYTITFKPTKKETIRGFCYMACQFLVLPVVLLQLNLLLPKPLDDAQLNVLYYVIDFLVVGWIFRHFLLSNIDAFSERPLQIFKVVLFGLARYFVLSVMVGNLIVMLEPEFMNANDAAIQEMVGMNYPLMVVGVVFLVPPVEETLFRGLIFRNLYDKSKVLAYTASVVVFSAIHIIGYAFDSPTELFISFLQYVPAGLCLAWAYTRADTIFAPILIHAIVNAMGVTAMR